MALRTDIQELAVRTRAALEASHDYHTFSRRLFNMVRRDVQRGRRFRFQNPATRGSMDQDSFARLAPAYVIEYLRVFSFQHFVTLFEAFFFDLLRLWLAAYPRRLSRKQIELGMLLDAPDREAVVLAVIDKELNELKYERVAAWFVYLDQVVKLGCPSREAIDSLAEVKATRDILIHNQGWVNAVYAAKSGDKARATVGERLEVSEPYYRTSWTLVRTVVEDLAVAALSKA